MIFVKNYFTKIYLYFVENLFYSKTKFLKLNKLDIKFQQAFIY